VFEITGRTDSWSEVLAVGNGNGNDTLIVNILASRLIYARVLLEYVTFITWLRSVIKMLPSVKFAEVKLLQNIWFNKRTHPNEQRNGNRLSTKWVLGSDRSSVRSWPCAANQGVVVCGRAMCRKGLCIN